MIAKYLLVAAAVLCVAVAAPAGSVSKDLVLSSVTREVNLKSQVAASQVTISVLNSGSSSAAGMHLAFAAEVGEHVVFVGASAGGADLAVSKLSTAPSGVADGGVAAGAVWYWVDFASPLAAGAESTVSLSYSAIHAMTPFPTEVFQHESQFVVYKDHHYFVSPYKVTSQTSKVSLASDNVEDFTDLKPSSLDGSTLEFGPYGNIAPMTGSALLLHFENNAPFATVTRLERELELSVWGDNLAVTEYYWIQHTGATLKGGFSRKNYQRDPSRKGEHSWRSTRAYLPLDATEIYYRDQIGNISTTHVTALDKAIAVDIEPRFPMFGGWKTHFTFGYNQPLHNYLFIDADTGKYVLNTTFGVAFDTLVVDELEVRIVLPESVYDVEVNVPFVDAELLEPSNRATYLDRGVGRTVVGAKKSGVVAQHNVPFTVEYHHSRFSLLAEPRMLITAMALFFTLFIVVMRTDCSIYRGAGYKAQLLAEQCSSFIQAMADIQSERADIYDALDVALDNFNKNKDSAALQAAKSKADSMLSARTASVKTIIAELAKLSDKAAGAVTELNEAEAARARAVADLFSQARAGASKEVRDKGIAAVAALAADIATKNAALIESA